MNPQIKLTHGAKKLVRGKKNDSGLDLQVKGFSRIRNSKIVDTVWFEDVEDKFVTIYPNETTLLKTGVQISLPKKGDSLYTIEAQIRSRSGLSLKSGTRVTTGTIDNGYQGDYGINFKNEGLMPYRVNDGDRVAQVVFNVVLIPDVIDYVTEFGETSDRGEGGFGHTGL